MDDEWEFLDPVDVISKLDAKFTELIESKKWAERKEALEIFHKLLTDNPRLDPKQNYNEHVDLLKKLLEKDSNILVQSMAAKCLTGVASGLRTKFGPYASTVAPVIFERFKEKKPQLRDPLVECIDAVYATTNFAAICEDTMAAMQKPNPHIKIQVDLFLYRVFKKFNAANAPKKELKALAPILIKHTGEPDPEVRDAACSALGAIMKAIGKKSAGVLIKDLENDKLKMAKIEEFYEKAMAEAGPEEVNAMVQSIHKPDKPAAAAPVKVVKKPPTPTPPEEDEEADDEPLKLGGKSTAEDEQAAMQEKKKKERSPSRNRTEAAKAPEVTQELLVGDSDREGRMNQEMKPRTLKWNFDAPTQEHREYLIGMLNDMCKQPLLGQLLGTDLKAHLKALEYLQQVLSTNPQAVINNVDILMKWSTLRFFETNPAVHLKLLEFWISVLETMSQNNQKLYDPEVSSFMPYLLMKSGDTKDVVRNQVKRIVQNIASLSTPGRTKNSRQKAECLQIMDGFLEMIGVNITATPQVTMKTIGACIADRDSSVRNAALNAIVTVYKAIGDRAFTLIGQLNPKEKAMLDERIKRAGRDAKVAPDAGDDFRPPIASSTPEGPLRGKSALNDTFTAGRSAGLNDTFNVGRSAGMNDTYSVMKKDESFADRLNALAGQGLRTGMNESSGRFALDPKFFEGFGQNQAQLFSEQQKYVVQNVDSIDLAPVQPAVRRAHRAPRRSESVSSISSIESIEQIDRVVCNLSSTTVDIVNESLAQLTYLLGESCHMGYLAERSELIMKTLVTQFSFIRNQHLTEQANLIDTSDLLRAICNFVINFVRTAIMEKISATALKQLLNEILELMCDERLNMLETKHQIIRSLNVIVVRICEHGDPTSLFQAITRLLMQYQESDPNGRMIGLIRKCVFKQSDSLMDADRAQRLDLEKVFETLHAFYEQFKPQKTESTKESCGTFDHYIQRLVILLRYKVLDQLHVLPNNSHVVTYTRRCVRALSKKDEENAAADPNDTIQASPIPRVLRQMFERLNETILDGGVEELFNYMDIHPEHAAHFEVLMDSSVHEYTIRDAFKELSAARGRKEVLPIGACVVRTLKEPYRTQVESQQEFCRMLDDFVKSATPANQATNNGAAASASSSNGLDVSTMSVAAAPVPVFKSRRSEPVRRMDPNETMNTTIGGTRRAKLSQDTIAAYKERLQNARGGGS
ncbi:CBR-ZYG-9 protein [Aphelenchoides avenae]|nr:CBR-ZYG-9 protein [Aphelenchus avenae]